MPTSRSSEPAPGRHARRGPPPVVCLALWALLVGGCDREEAPRVAAAPAEGAARTAPAPAPPEVPAPEGRQARLTRLEGQVTAVGSDGTLAAPMLLGALEGLSLAEGARAVIDLPWQARVTLEGPGTAYVGADRPGQLLLVSGGAHLSRAQGVFQDPPPRVATAHVSVELPGPGEVYLRADDERATYVAALAGNASLSTGEVSSSGELRSLGLPAGRQTLAAPKGWPLLADGPADLAAAREAATGALSALEAASDAAGERAEKHASSFEEVAAELARVKAEGRALVEAQRASAKAKQKVEARAMQPDVVDNARSMLRLRTSLFVRWERLQVSSLSARPHRGGVAASTEGSFGPYLRQAHFLLGLAPEAGR